MVWIPPHVLSRRSIICTVLMRSCDSGSKRASDTATETKTQLGCGLESLAQEYIDVLHVVGHLPTVALILMRMSHVPFHAFGIQAALLSRLRRPWVLLSRRILMLSAGM